MNSDYLTRQAELIDTKIITKTKVAIVGAGAIGSWVALSLAKMGVQDITVYDFDTVSIENMNCQFYPIEAIGAYKTTALQIMIREFTDVEIKTKGKWEGEAVDCDILLGCADSMQVRKDLFEMYKREPIPFFADSRMAAEQFMVLSAWDSDTRKSYETTLYTDSEAVQERCTAKATVYCANICAGVMVNQVKKFLMGGKNESCVIMNLKDEITIS